MSIDKIIQYEYSDLNKQISGWLFLRLFKNGPFLGPTPPFPRLPAIFDVSVW